LLEEGVCHAGDGDRFDREAEVFDHGFGIGQAGF
jgi:hypothetical protein